MNHAIEVEAMTCSFGRVVAVRTLTFAVPPGSIYALLGTNGAGKTTTIKTLLNLLTPSKGTVKVLGVEADRLSPRELARIGYVSENQRLPEYLTVGQLIAYCAAIYPTWDKVLCERLQRFFGLPLDRKLSTFSRGMKIKAALLISLAYRPELLILDEPFSGLDALVRDELVQGVLELSEQESWTILISSHDIDEVERLADWVGIIDRGVLQLSEPVETLRARFRRVDVTLAGAARLPDPIPETCLLPEAAGSNVRWIDSAYAGEAEAAARVQSFYPERTAFSTSPLSLREVFLATTRSFRLKYTSAPE